eukprot:scaffold248950_cov19-Tisochrysis_lutea.AAC.1
MLTFVTRGTTAQLQTPHDLVSEHFRCSLAPDLTICLLQFRATLVDELAGSSAVCIGAAVTVVGHVRCVPDAAAGFGKGSKKEKKRKGKTTPIEGQHASRKRHAHHEQALGTASITASSLTPSCAQAPWAD